AIEISLPGASSYSVLVLVECKDYSGKVPVNDLEEFWAKVEQVAGANVKGIFASTSAFNEGALNFAKSKGFAVLRHFANGDFKGVLKRSASWSGSVSLSEPSHVRALLTSASTASAYYDSCFGFRDVLTFSSSRLFEAILSDDRSADQSPLLGRVANPRQ